MDLRQLAALAAVADAGSFSAAARRLHTVQSNVSTHIARLERELGTTLVDRSSGALTEEGEVVVDRARRVHRELESLRADVASMLHDVSGQVRLGCIGTASRWLLPNLLREMAERAQRTRGPAALISGGECTVTIENEGGRGGRCAEFLLSVGIHYPQCWAIAADTDGIDGSEDNAGAVWTPDCAKRPGAREALERHDSYGFFQAAGTLVVTGPTRTNVNDYRAILIL